MQSTHARPIPTVLVALVAFLSAAAALVVSGGQTAHAHDAAQAHARGTLTQRAVAHRNDMRRLWEDHITWTRLAIISLTTDSPDTEATVGRLLANQAHIGDAFRPFYGRAAANELTKQLRAHILIAADVVAAARAGDTAKLASAQDRWVLNGDDIAALLHRLNPRGWPLAALRAELGTHLRLTTEEAVARLHGDWKGDVAVYDRIHRHALHLADLLSEGMEKQFPRRFR